MGITASCYNPNQNHLYVVDDKMYLTCYDLTPIQIYKRSLSKANNDTEQIMELQKQMLKLKFRILWQTKTNHEIVKLVKFIEKENVLCTCSFDKKVKLWQAGTGEYIDALQQNYNKVVPEPIAYYDTRKYMLINKNRKETIDNRKLDLVEMQNDPIKLKSTIEQYDALKGERSNKEWNLMVKI